MRLCPLKVYSVPIAGPQLLEVSALYEPLSPCPKDFCILGFIKIVSAETEAETVIPKPSRFVPFFVVIKITPLPAREP